MVSQYKIFIKETFFLPIIFDVLGPPLRNWPAAPPASRGRLASSQRCTGPLLRALIARLPEAPTSRLRPQRSWYPLPPAQRATRPTHPRSLTSPPSSRNCGGVSSAGRGGRVRAAGAKVGSRFGNFRVCAC